MHRFASLGLLILLLTGYLWTHGSVWEDREQIRREAQPGYVLPSGVSRVLAFGNKGLLADFLFLKASTFIGGKYQDDRAPSEDDWTFLVHSLNVVTDLDPFFLDPYIFAEGMLAWDAGMIEETNGLLQKGIDYRTWEWRLPFYAGFNLFYFQQDYERGADFVMAAAKIPGSPSFLQNLGARLAYYGKKTKTAVIFLKGMLAETSDQRMRSYLGKRLTALEAVSQIETAIEKYRNDFQQPPEQLDALVDAGYLDSLPLDPYGGNWFEFKGRILSTSRFSDLTRPAEEQGTEK